MRLSYTPISLLNIFLIAFLTLLLAPNARAQLMLAVNFPGHHFERERPLIAAADSDLIRSESAPDKHDEALPAADYSSKVNFLHTSVPIPPFKNARRIYMGYHPPRVRIYSASIQNSMRVTVKFFKVVIVPLCYAK